mmetsp:Transcript_28193/g.32620  ORF Transcript_28193/g.32620 Transcript_28193/m.32620 type:complete len:340 (-) Transcript_28193:86-1105(-)
MTSDTITIGINGFGRVGRSILSVALQSPAVRVTAINDPFVNSEYAAYLLKHDPAFSGMKLSVEVRKDAVIIDGAVINISQKSDCASIPWGDSRVTYVVECSGVHTTHDRAGAHLAGGASRVIITAPSSDAHTIIEGVNTDTFKSHMQVISAGSCTGLAISPVLRFLHERYGLEECTFTSIHAVTSSQKVVDGLQAKEWRAARNAKENIVPHSSGAMKTLQKAMPQLAERVMGTALRVPVSNGCALDLTVRLASGVSKEGLDLAISEASLEGSKYHRLLAFTNEELVSADAGMAGGAALYDSKASVSLNTKTHKLLLWYSHELGYAARVLNLIVETNSTW